MENNTHQKNKDTNKSSSKCPSIPESRKTGGWFIKLSPSCCAFVTLCNYTMMFVDSFLGCVFRGVLEGSALGQPLSQKKPFGVSI
jgi:hypothetical protein